MKIVMVSLALNIHEIGIADELYKLTNGNYWFVETANNSEDNSKGGTIDFSKRPFLIRVAESNEAKQKALRIIEDADIMLYGAAPMYYLKKRIETGKIVFNVSERWLKKGFLNFLSPRLIKRQFYYHIHCHGKPLYALCESAYAASDFARMFSFRDKCYKWGYFTAVPEIDVEKIQESKRNVSTVKILWVARFLQLKHPERMLQLALLLRSSNVDFSIDMIGVGPEHQKIASKIQAEGLQNCVHLLGSMPNSQVLKAMKSHHIFCFTSDRNEGWGAVLNEAMSSGCCPVSSIETGATPYLIKDGVNGFSFDLKKKNDLFEKVLWLIKHPVERENMSIEAYKTMRDIWNPANAAKQLHKLCEAMLAGKQITISEGPVSKAD